MFSNVWLKYALFNINGSSCVFLIFWYLLLKIFYTLKSLLWSSFSDLPSYFFLQVLRGFTFLVVTLTHTQAFSSYLCSDLLGFCCCCLGRGVSICAAGYTEGRDVVGTFETVAFVFILFSLHPIIFFFWFPCLQVILKFGFEFSKVRNYFILLRRMGSCLLHIWCFL